MARTLPPREQGLFKSVVRFYETKMFKKAIKTADQILKKFPEHGETLAMKGLTVNQLDRKEEAHELVRLGLRKDMTSHICWHVYGLLYRSDHDYHEAARAYINALRLDPDNQQILRDLAVLQVQIRDYDGFEESRRKLLHLRPSLKMNWFGVAISFQLQKNYEQALLVVQTYLRTLEDGSEMNQDSFEQSELLLYKVSVMEESGDFAGALENLTNDEHLLVDRVAVREARARLLAKLSRFDEASAEYRTLLSLNPDNHMYHKELHALVTRSLEDPSTVLEKSLGLADELSAMCDYSRAGQRVALTLLPSGEHPQFLPRADRYVRPMLRRGVPSLFADLKALYADSSKANAFGNLVEGYLLALKGEVAAFPALLPLPDVESKIDVSPDAEEEKDVKALPWVHHFLAQHYDRLGEHERALSEIDEAISTGTDTIESRMVKGRILKHCGDTANALAVLDEARKMDLSDRFVNSKCTKYSLRADNVSQAESWISLFTRDGDSGGVQALYDMQCIWYELEAAESHLRCDQIALALKKFTAVERHFSDMIEDQFDFHTYCLRKVTLRSYVDMLRMEDQLRAHPYFQRAAVGLIECLLRLYDMPEAERVAVTDGSSEIAGFAEMSEAERKKALSKKKKRDARKRNKQNAAASTAPEAVVNGSSVKSDPPTAAKSGGDSKTNGSAEKKEKSKAASGREGEKGKDMGWMEKDPDGQEHMAALLDPKNKDVDPLLQARNRNRLLEQFAPNSIQTHALAFDVAIRRKKYMQALRAVRRAQAIDEEHPETLRISVRLVYELGSFEDNKGLSDEARAVFKKLGDVLNGQGVVDAVIDYVKAHAGNGERQVGAGLVMIWMAQADISGSRSVDSAVGFLHDSLRGIGTAAHSEGGLSAEVCADLFRRLQGVRPALSSESISTTRVILRDKFPRATLFAVSSEKVN